jgi:nucleoside-diphosphate-sugar epimerase
MPEKVLITGIAGFLGSNLARRLLKEGGYDVAGIDNLSWGRKENIPRGARFSRADIRDKAIDSLFRGVDVVFHLAAKNCISDCQADPQETADINIGGTVRVLEAARRAGVRKIVLADSSAVYEGTTIWPTPETEEQPRSVYAASKACAAHLAEAYGRHRGMTVTGLRYFCVYGPVQDYRRTIPPVISAFIIKLLKDERPVIFGTGEKRRDFIYVDDVNDFHLLCLTDGRTDGRTFNLGSGRNHSVSQILDLIGELLGKRPEPLFRPDLPGEAEVTLADITRARELGWRPRTDLRSGLGKAIAYIRSEREAGRI